MSAVSHPSALSPVSPRITLDLAPGWDHVPGGRDLLRAECSGDPDRALTVSVQVQALDEPIDAVVRDVLAADLDRVGAQQDPAFDVELAGQDWTGHNVGWEGPGVAVHLVTGRETAAVRQVVVISGRSTGATAEADYDAIQAMVESLTLDWGGDS